MDPDDVHSLTQDELRQRCSQQSERFFAGRSHDFSSCYELFRRAVQEQDSLYWQSVFDLYQPLASRWVTQHPAYRPVLEEPEYFANWAFENMWARLSPEKLDALSAMPGVLRFLQMCIHSALVSYLRGREKTALLDEYVDPVSVREALDASAVPPIDEQAASPGTGEYTLRGDQAGLLWRMLGERLQNDRERQVVTARYVLALRLEEIPHQYPDSFTDASQAGLVLSGVLERLRKDRKLTKFLFEVGEEPVNLESRLTGMLYRLFCPAALELGEYHLGTLSSSQPDAIRPDSIRQHLAGCPHCTRELVGLQSYLQGLSPEIGSG